jgi:hypothetical protein
MLHSCLLFIIISEFQEYNRAYWNYDPNRGVTMDTKLPFSKQNNLVAETKINRLINNDESEEDDDDEDNDDSDDDNDDDDNETRPTNNKKKPAVLLTNPSAKPKKKYSAVTLLKNQLEKL